MERYVCLVFLSFCLSVNFANSDKGCCERSPEDLCSKCCSNHKLVNGTCYECDPGHWNKNCSEVCDYPHYGNMCLPVCDCDPHLCHPVTGCSKEAPNNTETLLEMEGNKHENIVQSREENDKPISNVMNISHSQIVLMVGGTALGCCILTIILLVIIIIRRQQPGRVLDADYHELQMLRHHKENLERKTTPVEMNTYKGISLMSKSRSSDSTGSHCYQDIPEYIPMERNSEKRGQGSIEMGSCYQKIEASYASSVNYETPIFMLPTLPETQ